MEAPTETRFTEVPEKCRSDRLFSGGVVIYHGLGANHNSPSSSPRNFKTLIFPTREATLRHHGTFRVSCLHTFRRGGVEGVLRRRFSGREENYLLGSQQKWKPSVTKDRAKSVHVYADGRIMVKYASLPHDTHGKFIGVPISDNTVRPFKFADVQTTGAEYPPVSNRSVMLILCLRVVQMKIQSPATSV